MNKRKKAIESVKKEKRAERAIKGPSADMLKKAKTAKGMNQFE